MKKCLLFVALFVASSTVLSIVFSDNTYAQSQYDDYIRTTEKLELKQQGRNYDGTGRDHTEIKDWKRFIDDRENWGAPSLNNPTEQEYSSLKNAIENGNYIVHVHNQSGNKIIYIQWVDTEISVNWNYDELDNEASNVRITRNNLNSQVGSWSIHITHPGGLFQYDQARIGSARNNFSDNIIGGIPQGYYNNDNDYRAIYESKISMPNYPIGYIGPLIGNIKPINSGTSFWVNFNVSHVYTDIKAKYTNYQTDPEPSNLPEPNKIQYMLLDPDYEGSDHYNLARRYNDMLYQLPENERQYIELPYGVSDPPGGYVCSAQLERTQEFTSNDCTINPLRDEPVKLERKNYILVVTPYEYHKQADDITIKPSVFSLDLSQMLDNGDTERCEPGASNDEYGLWCATGSDFEECDFADLGCHIRNLGVLIMNGLKHLFIPNSQIIDTRVNEFTTFIQNKLGFIYDSTAMFFGFIGSIVTGASNPTCNLNTGSISGKSVNINLCNARNIIGSQAFDLGLALFRGVIALGFAFASLRILIAFFKDREEITV